MIRVLIHPKSSDTLCFRLLAPKCTTSPVFGSVGYLDPSGTVWGKSDLGIQLIWYSLGRVPSPHPHSRTVSLSFSDAFLKTINSVVFHNVYMHASSVSCTEHALNYSTSSFVHEQLDSQMKFRCLMPLPRRGSGVLWLQVTA